MYLFIYRILLSRSMKYSPSPALGVFYSGCQKNVCITERFFDNPYNKMSILLSYKQQKRYVYRILMLGFRIHGIYGGEQY